MGEPNKVQILITADKSEVLVFDEKGKTIFKKSGYRESAGTVVWEDDPKKSKLFEKKYSYLADELEDFFVFNIMQELSDLER